MASPSITSAVALQRRLAERVERRDRIGPVRLLGGIDVSVVDDRSRAAVVVLDAKTLAVIERRTADLPVRFPYIPGLLAFREMPVITRAWRKVRHRPDLVFVDGMGLIHPRRCGLACHVGVAFDVPTLGCGKTPYIGEHGPVALSRGAFAPVLHEGERLGAALRTRDGVNVVYASTGHRISLRTAMRWMLRTAVAARLPEPIRAAHQAASLVH